MELLKMTKVYMVDYTDWDWYEIISVHKTRLGAEAALKQCKENPDKTTFKYSDFYDISEHELND